MAVAKAEAMEVEMEAEAMVAMLEPGEAKAETAWRFLSGTFVLDTRRQRPQDTPLPQLRYFQGK